MVAINFISFQHTINTFIDLDFILNKYIFHWYSGIDLNLYYFNVNLKIVHDKLSNYIKEMNKN